MGLVAALLCSCSTASRHGLVETAPVRRVDFRQAPELKDLAERARQLGNLLYPQVCALLADGDAAFPRQFDIEFKRKLPRGRTGDSPIGRIRLSAAHADQFREKPGLFDQVLVHEMTHVAQHYDRRILGRWLSYSHDAPLHWREGIADYVCFQLGQTNEARCAQCDLLYPDLHNGYSCAGAFLLYVERTYNSNIVRQLNTRLRDGGYSEAFFAKVTGRTLPELWSEFQQTAAFTPDAARMLELQQSLGYVNGKPPKDVMQRLDALEDQRADAFTKDLMRSARIWGQAKADIQPRLALFLYFTQPGGTAEAFLVRLKKAGKVPGFTEGEKGTLSGALRPGDLGTAFPTHRGFTAIKRDDPSRYHYEVARDSAEGDWQLRRAWRAHADGTVAEEFPVCARAE